MARGKEVMGRLRAEGRHTKRELQVRLVLVLLLLLLLLCLLWLWLSLWLLLLLVLVLQLHCNSQAQVKNSNFWVTLVNTAALIAFYYSSSIGLTFYQSWLMKELRFVLAILSSIRPGSPSLSSSATS